MPQAAACEGQHTELLMRWMKGKYNYFNLLWPPCTKWGRERFFFTPLEGGKVKKERMFVCFMGDLCLEIMNILFKKDIVHFAQPDDLR